MTTVLQTRRMLLREFTNSDLDQLAAMVANGDQMRFYPRPKTRREASEWIDRNLNIYQEFGFGFWLMEGKETSEYLGYCGIRPITVGDADEIEIGWHTRKEFWNQGLATEGATACRDFAFERFGIPRLVALIDPAHNASLRVATKIGMFREKAAIEDGWQCAIYAIERSESTHVRGRTL